MDGDAECDVGTFLCFALELIGNSSKSPKSSKVLLVFAWVCALKSPKPSSSDDAIMSKPECLESMRAFSGFGSIMAGGWTG